MRSALLCVLAAGFAAAALEPRVLVRTVTTSAIGEAHGVYVHTVELNGGTEIGVPLWLSADAPVGSLRLSGSGRIAASAVTESRVGFQPRNGIAVFGTLPVPPLAADWFGGAGTGVERIAGFMAIDDAEWLASFGPTTLPNTNIERGTIVLRPLDPRGAATGPGTRQLVPGIPAAGVAFRGSASLAVLGWDDEAAAWAVHFYDAANGGRLRNVPLAMDGSRFDGDAALGVTQDERFLIALIPDPTAHASGAASNLVAIDVEQLAAAGEPIRIPGAPNGASAITSAGTNGVWTVTRDPISAFGYATFLVVDDNGAAVQDDPSYTSLDFAPIAAVEEESNRVAIAAGNRLEIRRAGKGADGRHEFDAAIRALAWQDGALLVGEGGRLHRLDAETMAVTSTIQFQDGRVDAIVPIPDAERNENDADGDGLFDGVDPDAREATPVLFGDREVRLRAGAAGYESRVLRFAAAPTAAGTWTVDFDPAAAPWLHIAGMTGPLPGGPTLRLDRGTLPASASLETALQINAAGPKGERFAGSPFTVRVRVVDTPENRRTIAWALGDADNRERARTLSQMLSGAPFHFSQHGDLASLPLESDDTAILVMDESAAAASLVTRRAAANFVRGGGSLVFIRSQAADESIRNTESWLSPFGVTLAYENAATAPVAALAAQALTRGWNPQWLTQRAAAFTVTTQSDPVFAYTGAYGLGRFAVFASPIPLLGANAGERRFAAEVFAWLARAPLADAPAQRDTDGDGLADGVEDRDRSGTRDPGETDWSNPDTDGDGIPDGAEDVNLNGGLDAGETSPLITDTDGDGIWDGADATPIPPFAAPLIAAVIPDTSPAHGGRTVVIQGRNLRSSQRVWFGDRLATDVRAVDSNALSVVVPPASLQAQSPEVEIRVEDTETGMERAEAGLFAYSRPAFVQFDLRPVAEAAAEGAGVIAARLASSEKVALGRVALVLETEPPNAVAWGAVTPGVAAAAQGRSVTGSAGGDGSLAIAIGAARHAQGMGELILIPWVRTLDGVQPITVRIRSAQVTADNGYPLRVDASATADLP